MTKLYFDSMASTYIKPEVIQAMLKIYNNHPGNPSSDHCYAKYLANEIELAKQQVLTALKADKYELVWTSGATESINLALQGAAKAYNRQGKHLITFKTEHKATLEAFQHLSRSGFTTSILDVNNNGQIELARLLSEITPKTILVSICHVNNEVGCVQDLISLVPAIQGSGCLVHIDAAQSIGKAELDLQKVPADFVSLSAHKFSGPQGIGALLIRQQPKRQIEALCFGGKQQYLRPGTMPTALIVGMGVAIKLAGSNNNIERYRQKIIEMLDELGGISLHGCSDNVVAHNLNIHIDGINSQSLKYLLSDIALASGSACNASSPEPSHVLLALGYTAGHAANSIRISLGDHLTDDMVDNFCSNFSAAVVHLRRLSGYEHA